MTETERWMFRGTANTTSCGRFTAYRHPWTSKDNTVTHKDNSSFAWREAEEWPGSPLNVPFPICTKMLALLCRMAVSWVSICQRKKVAVPPQTHVLKSWEVGPLKGTEAKKAKTPWVEAIVSNTREPRELFSLLDMWGSLVCFYCCDKMTESRLQGKNLSWQVIVTWRHCFWATVTKEHHGRKHTERKICHFKATWKQGQSRDKTQA